MEPEGKLDQNSLELVYKNWPEHFKSAGDIAISLNEDHSYYNHVVLCGMGGSATACDIVNDLMKLVGNIPCSVVRGHKLPLFVNERSIVIINSASGNTVETLNVAKEASDRKAEIIGISSGGKLKDYVVSEGHRHVNIPYLSLPRASLPYLVVPCLKTVSPFLNDFDFRQTISEIYLGLLEESKNISMDVPQNINRAKRIASFLQTGFIFCFTSPFFLSVGTRFKNSLNENAKLHCSKDSILESSHNEIVPFTYIGNPSQRRVVLASWKHDTILVKERFSKVESLFSQIAQPWYKVISEDSNLAVGLLRLMFVLDYATIYIAMGRGLDPSPTPAIDILKRI
jgi:glucose/mannose-6-phosphate isomerase